MSSKSKKRTVSQAELRQMMNDMKKKRGNSAVTTKPVKSSPLSAEDIKTLQEKKLKLLKQKKKSVSFSNQVQKEDKKITNKNVSKTITPVPKKSSLKQKTEIKKESETVVAQTLPSGLPADFFDNGMKPPEVSEPMQQEITESNEAPTPTKEEENKSAIPEGFFDNPTADAKVRGVETPADVMDKEWESFKKEIQREETQSEQIIDEVQEVTNIDRQIDEIDEQLRCLSRVELLNDRKDARHKVKKEEMDVDSGSDEDSSEDDLDINSFDWREKDAFIS